MRIRDLLLANQLSAWTKDTYALVARDSPLVLSFSTLPAARQAL